MDRSDIKIFQIGFNRCGTRTIHQYLRANGLRGVHWDGGRLAKRMVGNLDRGNDILAGYERYQAFSDMEWLSTSEFLEGYKLYPQLAAQYPHGIFILNTRDREAWIRSRFAHHAGRYAAQHKAYLGIACDNDLAEYWRGEWDAHHAQVTDFFAGNPYRFFICRIETDLPHLFDQMLPEIAFDHSTYAVQVGRGPHGALRRLRRSIKRRLRSAFG